MGLSQDVDLRQAHGQRGSTDLALGPERAQIFPREADQQVVPVRAERCGQTAQIIRRRMLEQLEIIRLDVNAL
ncbi:hypothetical protein SDC9_118428 [bioreactor metagenome]|uniref:Uncharacterized protein n=1 Tax=bioreactor metagenome TaxID=1076179 RepID=A0A645C7T9_9ZZZZ